LDLNYLFPDEQIDVPHNNEESQPETGSQDFGIVVDNNVGDLIRKLTNVDTDNEDTENLKDLEAEIAKIKETSPAPTPNPEAEKKENGVSQTSSAPTPPSNCVSVIRSNTQAQPGKIQRASVSHRETPYTVPSQFQCDKRDFSSRSQHDLKIHTGKAHKLHTVSLPCTTSVVCNLIPVNFTSNDGVISCVFQPQPSSTLPSQNAPAFSAPATSIIPQLLNSTAAPEAEKKETAVQKHRRLEKKKEDEAHLSLKSLIDDNNRLKASIAARLEQELGLPQSQTSSAPTPSTPPPSSASVRASNTAPSHFQCDQCDFSSPSPHGLKVHTGKAHKLDTMDLSSTALDPANAKRCKGWRGRDKIKKHNAVEELKRRTKQEQEKNDHLKAQLNRIRVE